MAIRDLSITDIDTLIGSRHEATGFEYPINGLQPYYTWLISSLQHIADSSAGDLRVFRDDLNNTSIGVLAGRATLNGELLTISSMSVDLALFNNDIAYVWFYSNNGVASIGFGQDGNGWPGFSHIKLAEVTISAGNIVSILDRRRESIIKSGLDLDDAKCLSTYTLSIATLGNTSTPSVSSITLTDTYGTPIHEVDYLRVRVCNNTAYTPATTATLSVYGNTTVAEMVIADKDLILKSHTDGTYAVEISNSAAETVTVRIGSAHLSSRRGDYSANLDITHA